MPAGDPTAGAGLIAALVRDGGRPFRYRVAVARLVGIRPPEVQAIARAGRYGAPVPPRPAVRRPRAFQGAAAERAPAVDAGPRSAAVPAGAAPGGDAAPRAAIAPPVARLSGDRTVTLPLAPPAIAGARAAAPLPAATVTGGALAPPAAPAGTGSEPPRSIQVPGARLAPGARPTPASAASAPPARERTVAPARSSPTPAIARAGAAPPSLVGDHRAARTPARASAADDLAPAVDAPPRATAPRGDRGAPGPAAITVADLTAIRAMATGGAPRLSARTAEQAAIAGRVDLAALAAGHPLRAARPPLAASAPLAPAAITDARLHDKIAELTREVAVLRQGQRSAAAAPAPRPAATAPASPPPATPSDAIWARRHAGARRFRVGRG